MINNMKLVSGFLCIGLLLFHGLAPKSFGWGWNDLKVPAGPAGFIVNNGYSTPNRNIQRDIAYINLQVFSIKKADSNAIVKLALDSPDSRIKAAGCLVAGEKNYDFVEDLIHNVNDDDELVRQASRQALIYLSNKILCEKEKLAKPVMPGNPKAAPAKNQGIKAVDFGPIIGEQSNVALNSSQNMWKVWFAENLRKNQNSHGN